MTLGTGESVVDMITNDVAGNGWRRAEFDDYIELFYTIMAVNLWTWGTSDTFPSREEIRKKAIEIMEDAARNIRSGQKMTHISSGRIVVVAHNLDYGKVDIELSMDIGMF